MGLPNQTLPSSSGAVSLEFKDLVEKISLIVAKISGNKLGEKQAFMVEMRLKKRIMELGLKTVDDYTHYLEKNLEKETGILVGILTTHHTFFFREFPHFEILRKLLPGIVTEVKKRGEKTLKIWSAACSRGQEVYSIAMFLEYYLPEIDPSMSYHILGTDIDLDSIKIAQNGVYHQNEIKEIPMNFIGQHWAKGTGDIALYAKVKSSLKNKCEFRPGNLLKIEDSARAEKFDVIFCRNVFIYFEPAQIEQMANNMLKVLYGHGVFFSGISEPLSGLKVDVQSVGPSTYMFKNKLTSAPKTTTATTSTTIPQAVATTTTSAPSLLDTYKVLCVDDSGSILTLLKKILSKDYGFEVVATAINGLDAMEKMKMHKIDLVTLDIHMPEMDGVTYLEKNYNKHHPPVMIISSASRADSDVAMKALKFGASDFVEKPALNNLEERGEEIRTKLRSIMQNKNRKTTISSIDFETQKKFTIKTPEQKMRLIFASINDFSRIAELHKTMDQAQPPTVILFEGQGELLEALVKDKKSLFNNNLELLIDPSIKLQANTYYLADFKTHFELLKNKYSKTFPTSMLVYGTVAHHSAKNILTWDNAQLLLEDLGDRDNDKHPLKSHSTDVVPITSFPYMSCRYLSTK